MKKLLFYIAPSFMVLLLIVICSTSSDLAAKNIGAEKISSSEYGTLYELNANDVNEVFDKLDFTITRTEKLGGETIYYGITPYGGGYINSTVRFNCQIIVSEDRIRVGYPLVYTDSVIA